MKHIQITVGLTDDLGVKSITFDYNDTHLPCDSKLIELLSFAMLTSCRTNKESMGVQDLLNETGIKRE